jgi:dihydroorotate dehydrogenase electron transfer subunit
MQQFLATILFNESCGPRCRKLRVAVPERTIRYVPGQFFHIRCGRGLDPLLRRPFSVYAIEADAGGWVRHVDFLYLIVGRGTQALADRAAGEPLDLLGPLGRGFQPPPEPAWHVMVAGGVGIAPFYDLALFLLDRAHNEAPSPPCAPSESVVSCPLSPVPCSRSPRITLLFGARTVEDLYGLRDLESLPIEIRLATDDGSRGHRGFVTDLLAGLLDECKGTGDRGQGTRDGPIQVYGCGPEPMMDTMVRIAQARGLPCQLSLDRRMGCGLGACGACVCKVRAPEAPDGWDYLRICRDGPVVEAAELMI